MRNVLLFGSRWRPPSTGQATLASHRTGYLNGTTSGWTARSLFWVDPDWYWVVLDTSATKIRVYKSSNGGVTWAEMDSANALTHTDATHSYDAGMANAGGNIFVAYRTATNTIRVRAFDVSTDTWTGSDVGAANVTTAASETRAISVVVRSDGDIVFGFTHTTGPDWRQKFWTGASWTGENSNALNAFIHGMVVTDADITHAWGNTTSGTYHQPIDAANTRGTRNTIDSSTTNVFSNFPGYVNDGGTHRICGLSVDSTGEMDFYYGTSSTNVTFTTVSGVSPTSTTDPGIMGGAVVPFNSKWYVIWSGDGRGEIHMDVSDDYASPAFGTDTTIKTGLSVDPSVYAAASDTGILVAYTDHTQPSVSTVWAVGP